MDSDLFLRAEGGGTITFYDGWDETVFAGTEKVCVVSDALAEKIEVKNGAEVLHIVTRDGLDTELTVVGLSVAGVVVAVVSVLAGLFGSVGSAAWICRADPMKLMKAEE